MCCIWCDLVFYNNGMKKYWTMLLVLCMCMYSWAFAVNVETFDLTQTSAPVGPQSNRM